uniref:Uncharacterized protein n=1 Tax=Arundo donax TaxID=35708 RepID=A0A0A9H6C4_ARUDO
MNSTCIQHRDSMPKYIHIHVGANMLETPYTMGKYKYIYI